MCLYVVDTGFIIPMDCMKLSLLLLWPFSCFIRFKYSTSSLHPLQTALALPIYYLWNCMCWYLFFIFFCIAVYYTTLYVPTTLACTFYCSHCCCGCRCCCCCYLYDVLSSTLWRHTVCMYCIQYNNNCTSAHSYTFKCASCLWKICRNLVRHNTAKKIKKKRRKISTLLWMNWMKKKIKHETIIPCGAV